MAVWASSKPKITDFGVQAGTENTMFAAWSWSMANTDRYQVMWYYDTGDGVWFIGDDSTTSHKQCTYSAPDNAKRVKFKVKALSKTHKVNNIDTAWWMGKWSTEITYNLKERAPVAPSSAPSVSVDKYNVKAEVSNVTTTALRATTIEFQVVKDETTYYKKGTCDIVKDHASFTFSVDPGHNYKVRCRSIRRTMKYREPIYKNPTTISGYKEYYIASSGDLYSPWTEYSSVVETIPATPSNITSLKAESETSVYISWSKVATANTYDIQYSTKKEYLDSSSQSTTITGIDKTNYIKTGLDSGERYFFRVRATNGSGSSSWSPIKSITLGKKPGSPTTWSSTTTGVSGNDVILYWVHNSQDGSTQSLVQIEMYVNGVKEVKTIDTSTQKDDEKTTSYSINTSTYTEGTKILWRVRTAGVTKSYGDWSIQRTIDIYAPATLSMSVKDSSGNPVTTLTSYPFKVTATAGPSTQIPISYQLTIVSNETYETVDETGNSKTVRSGDEVYSRNFDISTDLDVDLTPGDVNLENNVLYSVTCIVAMNSGLTATSESSITVSWSDEEIVPNAEVTIDMDSLSAYIHPYCLRYTYTYYSVTYDESAGTYTRTETVLESPTGTVVDDTYTTEGDEVYISSDGSYYTEVRDDGTIVEGVTLSVYRREFDGSFTEVSVGIENSETNFVTDPHPSLDFARYRIVATLDSTGEIGFIDIPGVAVSESSVVIQWDEDWSEFDASSEDMLEQPPWSGSMLKIPYNVDVSDNRSPDVTGVKYAGRKRPVSYYGTQLGETATWSVEIPKSDKDTLYALRRLSVYMGDVYVREPSGSGYWASVNVSFSQKHCEVTIPVTFTITRVEGGV